MPAARQASRSPASAFAVSATTRVGSFFLRDFALAQLARGDEAVHDGHLAVHEHHVEVLLLERVERLDAVAGVHARRNRGAAASRARACG